MKNIQTLLTEISMTLPAYSWGPTKMGTNKLTTGYVFIEIASCVLRNIFQILTFPLSKSQHAALSCTILCYMYLKGYCYQTPLLTLSIPTILWYHCLATGSLFSLITCHAHIICMLVSPVIKFSI